MLQLSLRQNFSWTLVGNVVYAATQWGLLTLLAKGGTAEMVGQFALGLAITAPIALFANLQLRALQATDARATYDFGEYYGLRIATTVAYLVVVLAVAFLAHYGRETALVICAVGIAKAVEAFSDLYYGLFQQHERMDWISHSLMLRGILALIGMGAGLYLTRNLTVSVLGMACVWAGVLVFVDMRNARKLDRERGRIGEAPGGAGINRTPTFNARRMRSLAELALPLGFVMMLISLSSNVPRYFIERDLGVGGLGIFAALAYVLVAGSTVVGALGQAASSRLATYYSAGNREAFGRLVYRLSAIALLIGVAGVAVAWAAGGPLLTLLYTPEYAEQKALFVWLMIAGLISYVVSIQGYTMTAARYLRVQVPLSLAVLAVTTGSCFVLIPRFGLVGAAWALCVASLVQLILGVAINRRAVAEMPIPEGAYNG